MLHSPEPVLNSEVSGELSTSWPLLPKMFLFSRLQKRTAEVSGTGFAMTDLTLGSTLGHLGFIF